MNRINYLIRFNFDFGNIDVKFESMETLETRFDAYARARKILLKKTPISSSWFDRDLLSCDMIEGITLDSVTIVIRRGDIDDERNSI